VHNGICLNALAIIFGADVIHPTAGEDSSAFIAAVSFLLSANNNNCIIQMLYEFKSKFHSTFED
jgi:hypothetical protein